MSNQSKNTRIFCESNAKDIDYKDTFLLKRFINSYMKMLPRRKTGICAWHQRKLSMAIKRSRIMALIPFVSDKS